MLPFCGPSNEVVPNRACSGRGYAPGRPARQKFGKTLAVGGGGQTRPAADAAVRHFSRIARRSDGNAKHGETRKF